MADLTQKAEREFLLVLEFSSWGKPEIRARERQTLPNTPRELGSKWPLACVAERYTEQIELQGRRR